MSNKIVDLASNFIGKVKYVFGANNIEGGTGDCSSFTQYIYSENGLNIGRDTESQWTGSTGSRVDKDKLQVGDLVFFKNTYQSNHTDGVSHVGIYTGSGEFIHLNSKGVTKDNLNSDYWSTHYLGAKTYKTSTPDTGSSDSSFEQTGFSDTLKKPFEELKEIIVDFFKDQAETILTFLALILITVMGVIAIVGSIKSA